jgi:Organic solute transporter Ostalpha
VHSTDPHLIAWFNAGAFVLLGYPVSMWGILGHLTNYNAPHIQVYIVRILWMVPIYSIESWLAMRFHKKAVLIETARDVYESFVLYCFLQFLIEVLGGEEALVLMLKDKSPTRGVHMWGLQWCGVKPWLMGQPVRRSNDDESDYRRGSVVERVTAAMSPTKQHVTTSRVHWTSPFFIKCKFGVLQYVLLKFLCAVAVLLLEWKGWYKEGQFHWKAGYLYICILTNVSQCWAVYCLIFFYYATKTELSPI